MRLFLALTLCLLGSVLHVEHCRAATPAFSGFYGSNGVTVLTNPATGRIIISGPTNTITATNVTVGTNSVYFTNECVTTANGDTNRLVASDAGTAAANVTYTLNPSTGIFTNGNLSIGFDGEFWSITNSGSQLYTRENDSPIGAYSTVAGGNPAPTVAYAHLTNCVTVFSASSAVSLPAVSTNLYVTLTLGNDTNGTRGRLDRKYKTLEGALADAIPGSTIELEEGDYPISDITYVTNDVKIIGAGRKVTRIGTAGGTEQRLRPRTGSFTMRNLTLFGCLQFGTGPPSTTGGITNAVIENCDIHGDSDAIEADIWDNIRIENCFLTSSYDGIADWSVLPGGSNRVMTIVNTRILVTNNAFSVLHGISGGDSRIEMYGGSIEVLNGTANNNPIYLSVDTYRTNKTGSVLLSNVRLRSWSANNNAPFVTNFNNLPVFMDNCTMEAVRPTLVSGVYTQQWSDRIIEIPNGAARSNRVMNLTSLTNALVAASQVGHRFTVRDSGLTASGTNIWILGTFFNGPTLTNITADGGSVTIEVNSGNTLSIINSFP